MKAFGRRRGKGVDKYGKQTSNYAKDEQSRHEPVRLILLGEGVWFPMEVFCGGIGAIGCHA